MRDRQIKMKQHLYRKSTVVGSVVASVPTQSQIHTNMSASDIKIPIIYMNENYNSASMGEDQSVFGMSPTEHRAQANSSIGESLIDENPSRELGLPEHIHNIDRRHLTALGKIENSHVYSNKTSSAFADDSRGFPMHNLKPMAPERGGASVNASPTLHNQKF